MPTSGRPIALLAVAAAGYAGFVAWIVPAIVAPTGDDFGYFATVANTLRAQRLQVSDWLEPLNLPLTAVGVLGYKSTGSFYLSTLGFNVLLAGVNFFLLGIYLKLRLGMNSALWITTAGLASFPVWLEKATEYTGVPFGITCTLAAWICWERNRRVLFFVCVLVGFVNRQNALCLLAWPLADVIGRLRAGRSGVSPLILLGVVTLSIAFTLMVAMPPTWARELVSSRMLANYSLIAIISNLLLAVTIFTGCRAGLGALLGADLSRIWQTNLRRPMVPMVSFLLGCGVVLTGRAGMGWETLHFDQFGLCLLVAMVAGGAWLNDWEQPIPLSVAIYLVGYAAIVSTRGKWWDYYFIEPVLALAGCVALGPFSSGRWHLVLIPIVGLSFGLLVKKDYHDAERKIVAYEKALRRGDLFIWELSDAPFGYLGWKLFTTARTHPEASELTDFMKFVEGSRAHFDDGLITVKRDAFRKSIHPSKKNWLLPITYRDTPLPLDEEEWRIYLTELRSLGLSRRGESGFP